MQHWPSVRTWKVEERPPRLPLFQISRSQPRPPSGNEDEEGMTRRTTTKTTRSRNRLSITALKVSNLDTYDWLHRKQA
jgi:hypothetical protein